MKDSTKTLEFLFNFIKPKNYLEIGVRYAQTINELAKHSKSVIGVDPDKNCKKYIKGDNITFVNKTSDDFFKDENYKAMKFDIIFIDGLHTKNQADKDFQNALTRLSEEGWIFLHDTFPPNKEHTKFNLCGDVWQHAEKLKNTLDLKEYEFLTLPWGFGITCIHKKNKQVDF